MTNERLGRDKLAAVQRVRDPEDRRRQLVELTPDGQHLRRAAATAAHKVDNDTLGSRPAKERTVMRALLTRLLSDGLKVRQRH